MTDDLLGNVIGAGIGLIVVDKVLNPRRRYYYRSKPIRRRKKKK